MNIKPKGKTTEQKIAELKEVATDPLFLEDLDEIEKDFQYVDGEIVDEDREDWRLLAQQVLANAYGEDEPEYSLDMVKEINPKYQEKPSTGKELVEALAQNKLLGMWKDRQDIVDSGEFAQKLRTEAEKRE